jgi:S-methylmethionine-dependent homocysteine/selenocysteine methylase
MVQSVLGIVILCLVSACGPFKYEDFRERRLSVATIDSQTYSLTFQGFRHSTKLREFELLLLRASEIAVEAQFEYFFIENDSANPSELSLAPEEYILSYRYDKENGFTIRLTNNPDMKNYHFDAMSTRDVLSARYKVATLPY